VLVATDPDSAGQAAAERAYWLLAERGRDDVGHVHLPEGSDPAQLLAERGPTTIREALDAATSLPERLIDTRIAALADGLHTVEGKVGALRRAAEVVASRDPSTWQAGIDDLTARLDLMPQTVMREVVAASIAWDDRLYAPESSKEFRPAAVAPEAALSSGTRNNGEIAPRPSRDAGRHNHPAPAQGDRPRTTPRR
jgi:DNA primase